MVEQKEQPINYYDAEIILKAVHEQCDAHKAGIKAIQIHIDANSTVTGIQLKAVNDHLAQLNHSVADLYEKHYERGKVVEDFNNHKIAFKYHTESYERFAKPFWWAKKNWWVLTLLFLAVITLIVTVVDHVGAKGVVDAIKDVKDVL